MEAMRPGELLGYVAISEASDVVASSSLEAGEATSRDHARSSPQSQSLHVFALTDQAIVSGSNFLTTMLVARGLSLVEFGKYSLLWMAVLFGANIQMAFIIAPMMSIGPIQRRVSDKTYLGSILTFQIAFTALITLLIAAAILVLRLRGSGIDGSWIFPVLTANIAYQLQDFSRRVFFYQKRVIAALSADSISYIGQLLLMVLFLKLHRMSVTNVLWINALTSLLAVLMALPMMPLPVAKTKILLPALRRNWLCARYLLAATLMQWTSGNLFTLIAPLFAGVSVVGAMRACQSIMNMTNIWMQGLENSLPSEASRTLTVSGTAGLRAYILHALALLGGFTGVVVLVLNIAPEYFLTLIYGPHLKGYGWVLRAYGILAMLTMLTLPLRAGLRSLENTRPIFIGYIITTVYSVISAPLLGRAFGLPGILSGIIGTQFLLIPVLALSFRRSLSNAESG